MSRSILATGLAAVALVAMAFHVSFAQAQSGEQESEKAAVERTLRSYGDAFRRGDLSSISQHCNVPFVVIAPQSVRALATTAEVETFYGGLLRDLKEHGYSHSKWVELHVKLLGKTVALASGIFTRYKTDGSEMATLGATYLLRKNDGDWKIAVLTPHPASDVIRAD
jgi:ketosteroid isomerase-like protein